MTNGVFWLDRRSLLAGLGGTILAPGRQPLAAAAGGPALTLQAKPGVAALRAGMADTPVWSLLGPTSDTVSRFQRGEEINVTLENQLPIPIGLDWRGIDGVSGADPLNQAPLGPGGKAEWVIPLRHAGSFFCDLRQLGDAQERPLPVRAVIVAEEEPAPADRDEVLLIEDWRLRRDGRAIAPGSDPKDATALYTANGQAVAEIGVRSNDRLRLRFINACQRNVIALKIDDYAVLVMAIDGQPAEPFLARNGQLVLAPGTRIDVFIDAVRPPGSVSSIVLHDGTAPHPIARLVTSGEAPARNASRPAAAPLASNGLPARLELRNALRVELTLGETGPQPNWISPAGMTAAVAPAFQCKLGRVAVLALANRAGIPIVFHLHGHHFRLLDRLDDGWKPFWLDTLLIDAGQTLRIAFLAQFPGRWLMEAIATDWAAPRLVRWYSAE